MMERAHESKVSGKDGANAWVELSNCTRGLWDTLRGIEAQSTTLRFVILLQRFYTNLKVASDLIKFKATYEDVANPLTTRKTAARLTNAPRGIPSRCVLLVD